MLGLRYLMGRRFRSVQGGGFYGLNAVRPELWNWIFVLAEIISAAGPKALSHVGSVNGSFAGEMSLRCATVHDVQRKINAAFPSSPAKMGNPLPVD